MDDNQTDSQPDMNATPEQPTPAVDTTFQSPDVTPPSQVEPTTEAFRTPEQTPEQPGNNTRMIMITGVVIAVLAIAGAAGLLLSDYVTDDNANDSAQTTDQTEVEDTTNTRLPDDYPTYVPVAYPESTLVNSIVTDTNGTAVFNSTYSVTASTTEVFDYYKTALDEADFTVSVQSTSEEGGLLSATSKYGDDTISISITPDPEDATIVTYTVNVSHATQDEEQ